jgi:membrane protein YqaA with SNARE-associated domain
MLRCLYDWTMALAAKPQAPWWLFIISFAESSFFPIPPHAMLAPMCLANPKRALYYATICTTASVLGGLFGYWIGYTLFETVGQSVLSALGLAKNFSTAQCYLQAYGAEIILIKGATPIPFKLVTITAGFVHFNLFTFLWASIASRAFQFFLVAGLFWKFGLPIKNFIDKYLGLVATGFAIMLVGGFVAASYFTGHSKSDKCSHLSQSVH